MPALKPTDESVCGHCGYAVRGLDSFTCPECGSDLREVGIVPPPPDVLSECGNCGHRFRALESYTCPDCGADLREVGIVPMVSEPPRFPLWQVLATWTLVFWLPCLVVLLAAGPGAQPAVALIAVTIWLPGYILITRGHWARSRPSRTYRRPPRG